MDTSLLNAVLTWVGGFGIVAVMFYLAWARIQDARQAQKPAVKKAVPKREQALFGKFNR